jgi:hypothetical protein
MAWTKAQASLSCRKVARSWRDRTELSHCLISWCRECSTPPTWLPNQPVHLRAELGLMHQLACLLFACSSIASFLLRKCEFHISFARQAGMASNSGANRVCGSAAGGRQLCFNPTVPLMPLRRCRAGRCLLPPYRLPSLHLPGCAAAPPAALLLACMESQLGRLAEMQTCKTLAASLSTSTSLPATQCSKSLDGSSSMQGHHAMQLPKRNEQRLTGGVVWSSHVLPVLLAR